MRDPTQDTLQKTLMFEPPLRVSLPEAAQDEAVSVLGEADCGGDGRDRLGRERGRQR